MIKIIRRIDYRKAENDKEILQYQVYVTRIMIFWIFPVATFERPA